MFPWHYYSLLQLLLPKLLGLVCVRVYSGRGHLSREMPEVHEHRAGLEGSSRQRLAEATELVRPREKPH